MAFQTVQGTGKSRQENYNKISAVFVIFRVGFNLFNKM